MTNSSNSGKNSATPKDVAAKAAEVKDPETVVPAQAAAPAEIKTEVNVEPQDGEKTDEKVSLIQRVKAATEKLAKNRKAMLFLGGAAVVAGLAIKNNRRKAVSVEPLDEAEGPIEGVDDGIATDDSN